MILSVERFSFRYPASERDALRDISFSADRGEYIAVLGANGSGKSTLLRCIAGLSGASDVKGDGGAIRIFAESPKKGGKAAGGIQSVPTAVVFQTPDDQIVAETAELDAAFGPENLSLPRAQMRERVEGALSAFLPDAEKSAKTDELSSGQKQRLALAGAIAMNPDIILLDEPASMISEKDRAALLDFLDGARRDGKTILYVTHDIDDAMRASRILVLRRGELVFDGAREAFALIPDETLAEWSLAFKEESGNEGYINEGYIIEENVNHIEEDDAQALLECRELAAGPFCGVSLSLRKGEIAAVTGESGSGKSLFLEALAGIAASDAGEVRLKEGARAALAVQESEDALFEEFVADDVAFAPESAGLSGDELKATVREAMDAAGLPFETFADRKTFSLSGGEKRKAAIAGIIATGADVLLFDEPFSALDAKSRGEIVKLFRRLAKSGKCIIFTTNRTADCEGLADNVICLDSFQRQRAESRESESEMEASKGGARKGEPSRFFAAMPPVAKFLSCIISVAASLLISGWQCLACYALFLIITAGMAGYSLKKLFKSVLKILPWLLIIMAIQCFIFKSAEEAALFFLRFLCLLAALTVFVFITPPTEISCGAEDILIPLRVFKIPVRNVALLISLIFRFFSYLYSEAEKIRIARRVRTGSFNAAAAGKKKRQGRVRETAALIVPLVLRVLTKSEKLSLAISARYYTSGRHTRYQTWRLKAPQAAFLILSIAFSVLLVWASRTLM